MMPEAGWYPNPESPSQERWWDGIGWTDNVRSVTPAPPGVTAGPNGPQMPAGVSYQPLGMAPAANVDTWLWQSIVATILCCWPFGIPAIVFATKANSAMARNDIVRARQDAEKAKMWTLIAVGGGVLTFAAAFGLGFAGTL